MRSRWIPPSGGPGKLWLPVLVAGCVLALAVLAGVGTAMAQPPTIPGATYVGSDTCKGCHEDQAKKMEGTLHGKLLGTTLAKGSLQSLGCEACHGPGSKHIADPSNPANNLRFGKTSLLTAADKNEICLQCHARGKQILWKGSPHESRDVTCATCHTIHGPFGGKAQLKIVKPVEYDSRGQRLDKIEYDLCGQCHQVRAMQFQRSSHMPLRDLGEAGSVTCTSCHNPHGTVTEKLIAAPSVNQICWTCHANKRGPFLWEHPPVIESCLNCHQPHGSNFSSLLRLTPPRICQQCHANSGHNNSPYVPPNSMRAYNRGCINCHFNIHGSNSPSGTFFTR